jgi:hypothetical protein
VTISMTGLAPKSTHPANINKGSCAGTSDNGALSTLTPLAPRADQAGGPPPPGGLSLPTTLECCLRGRRVKEEPHGS